MASVTLDGVRKTFEHNGREQVAVHDIDVHVRDGELVVLVGPSGCGKSTTLRMIAGLESISGGVLRIGDRIVNDVPPKDRDVAMVFQNYALYPHMTAYENMAFALTLRHAPKGEIDARVREAAGILGIESLLRRKPSRMSGGQRQRVALGRAIVRKPQVFLFDEPLSNLDAQLRVAMRRELSRIHQHLGATMIYVTHDQVEAMTLGERIVVLNEGRVQQIDTPLALYERPRNTFVATFMGSPPMNLLPGELRITDGVVCYRSRGGAVTLTLAPQWAPRVAAWGGREVLLGIRPEDVRVSPSSDATSAPAVGQARVEIVEPLGGETLVTMRAGDQELTARVPPHAEIGVGRGVALAFDVGRIHLFDPATQQRLSEA
ncbi:MAG TPA: sn-glycerol-3-phosphate ABC transporter ATP-binding protein UgpC [Gemmatimonadaceae bacterium]